MNEFFLFGGVILVAYALTVAVALSRSRLRLAAPALLIGVGGLFYWTLDTVLGQPRPERMVGSHHPDLDHGGAKVLWYQIEDKAVHMVIREKDAPWPRLFDFDPDPELIRKLKKASMDRKTATGGEDQYGFTMEAESATGAPRIGPDAPGSRLKFAPPQPPWMPPKDGETDEQVRP